mmetsp:Transcript_13057/g.30920  ORF Transcript_13057/g.30920 Transcript_13057/m.30920 type:complete len:155 (-) Transcript_13057:2998-3462(-)
MRREPKKHSETGTRMPPRDAMTVGKIIVKDEHGTTELVGTGEIIVTGGPATAAPKLFRANAAVHSRETVENPDCIVNRKRPKTGIVAIATGPVTSQVKKIGTGPTHDGADVALHDAILKLRVGSAEIVYLGLPVAVVTEGSGVEGPIVRMIALD